MDTLVFDYDLPANLIAQRPAARRDEARLLALERQTGKIEHRRFRELPQLLRPGDLLVINDARVIPARIIGRKPTGGRVEITLIDRIDGEKEVWKALAKPARRMRPGTSLGVSEDFEIFALSRQSDGVWEVELKTEGPVLEALERVGRAPLPPYIHRSDDDLREEDIRRYQTVYARQWGAVAAPTAGLHFTEKLLEQIRRARVGITTVTLEVGWGSFAPIREKIAEDHRVEAEKFKVSEQCARDVNSTRAEGGRVVAVGTTTVRALESAWSENRLVPAEGSTKLFITPGYRFQAVDSIVTNFHLPRSSLIMLAAAFAGIDTLLDAYREAVSLRYRFYSYGDAMIII